MTIGSGEIIKEVKTVFFSLCKGLLWVDMCKYKWSWEETLLEEITTLIFTFYVYVQLW